MKKSSIIFVLISAVLLLSMTGVASAAANAVAFKVQVAIDSMTDFFTPILKVLLGDVAGAGHDSGFFLFAKLLLFILVFSIIYAVVEFLPFLSGKGKMQFLVTLIATILSVRFLEADMVSAIILPYSVLAVAVTAVLPFIIFAWALYHGTTSKLLRRIGWIFFAVVFIVLWIYRYDELGGARWIYAGTAAAALAMFLFDGTIRSFFAEMAGEKLLAEGKAGDVMKLRKDLADLDKLLIAGAAKPAEYDKEKKRITTLIKKISED